MNIYNYRNLFHKEIISILNDKDICIIGTKDNNDDVYLSPMGYIFEEENDNLNFFFACFDPNPIINSINKNISIFLDNKISNFYTDAYQTIKATGTTETITNEVQQDYLLNKFKSKYNDSLKKLDSSKKINFIKVSIKNISGREYNCEF